MGSRVPLNSYPPGSSTDEQTKMPISLEGLTTYFPIYCLRVQLSTRLHLCADWNLPLWDTNGSWHTLNYWSHKNKESSFDNHTGLRDNQKLIDEVHFLHKTTLSKWGEIAILPNAQKLTQRVKENEETKEYVPNETVR